MNCVLFCLSCEGIQNPHFVLFVFWDVYSLNRHICPVFSLKRSVNEKLLVSRSTHTEFGMAQWIELQVAIYFIFVFIIIKYKKKQHLRKVFSIAACLPFFHSLLFFTRFARGILWLRIPSLCMRVITTGYIIPLPRQSFTLAFGITQWCSDKNKLTYLRYPGNICMSLF